MKHKHQRSPGPLTSEADRRAELLGEISDALIDHPHLRVTEGREFPILVEGQLLLESSLGPFDIYSIRIEMGKAFPIIPPLVIETEGRIPCDIDRHASSGLCLEVWPVWLASNPTPTFAMVLEGPIRNFLLSQTIFERTGEWPFGERAHGDTGTIDAISELLGVEPPDFQQSAALILALCLWPNGHTSCRCGSGRRFRDCHRAQLEPLRTRLPKEVLNQLAGAVLQVHRRRQQNKAA